MPRRRAYPVDVLILPNGETMTRPGIRVRDLRDGMNAVSGISRGLRRALLMVGWSVGDTFTEPETPHGVYVVAGESAPEVWVCLRAVDDPERATLGEVVSAYVGSQGTSCVGYSHTEAYAIESAYHAATGRVGEVLRLI